MKLQVYVLLIAAIPFVACHQTTDSQGSSPLVVAKTVDGIEYKLSVQQTDFRLSDSLQLFFEVGNHSMRTATYLFANVQQFGFKLTDRAGTVAMYHPMIVLPATSALALPPGETKRYSMSLLFEDPNGYLINPGNYQLSAYLLDANSPEVALQICVK